MAVTLNYNNHSVVLPSPDFSNDQKLELKRIHTKTRCLDVILYKDPDWPKTETRTLRFSYLSEKQVKDFRSLLKVSLGKVVQMIDFEGQTVYGLIIDPEAEANQPGIVNRTLGFNFQMTLGNTSIANPLPSDILQSPSQQNAFVNGAQRGFST